MGEKRKILYKPMCRGKELQDKIATGEVVECGKCGSKLSTKGGWYKTAKDGRLEPIEDPTKDKGVDGDANKGIETHKQERLAGIDTDIR